MGAEPTTARVAKTGAQSETKHLKKHLKEERTRASYFESESVGFSLVESLGGVSGSGAVGGKSAG